MIRIAIISPYRHKAQTKFNSLIKSAIKKYSIVDAKADEFGDNNYVRFEADTSLEIIAAIPNEIESALTDKYFDIVYIDTDYGEDEVWTIRQHLIGNQSKPINYF